MNKSIVRNTLLYLMKTISTIIFPLIVFPYISKLFGVEIIGKIEFSLSIINYLLGIATFGGTMYCVRIVAKYKHNEEKLGTTIRELFLIQLITTVLAYVGLIILLQIPFFSQYSLILVINSSMLLLTLIGFEWVFIAFEEYFYITIRHLIFQVISLVLIFVLVQYESDYIVYIVILTLSAAGSNIINLYSLIKRKLPHKGKINLKRHIKPMFYMFLVNFLAIIGKNMANTLLGVFHDNYEVGIYSTAFKVFKITDEFITAFTMVMYARIATIDYYEQKEKFNKFLNSSIRILLLIAVPIAFGVFIVSNSVIYLIAGENYYESGSILAILAVGVVFQTINKIFAHLYLLSRGKEREFFIATAINVVSGLLLSFVLIPLLGPSGAAIAFIIGEFLMMISLFFFIKTKEFNMIIIKYIVKYGVISSLFFIVSFIMGKTNLSGFLELLLLVLTCVIVYIIGILMTNDYERKELLDVISKIKNRRRDKK